MLQNAFIIDMMGNKNSSAIGALSARVLNLEENESLYEVYTNIGTTPSGTVTIYPQATIILDRYAEGIDAICVKLDTQGNPIDAVAKEADGTPIEIEIFDIAGNYQLSGTPSGNSGVIYFVKIDDKYKSNIPLEAIVNVLELLDTDDIEEGVDNLYFTSARAISALQKTNNSIGWQIAGGTTSRTLTVSANCTLDQDLSTLSNVIFAGLTINKSNTTGFSIDGGSVSKTLTVSETCTINQNLSSSSNVIFGGLTINKSNTTGFSIDGGSTSKTLTVSENCTLDQSLSTLSTPIFASLISPIFKPSVDSSAAIRFTKANGITDVVVIDTTSSIFTVSGKIESTEMLRLTKAATPYALINWTDTTSTGGIQFTEAGSGVIDNGKIASIYAIGSTFATAARRKNLVLDGYNEIEFYTQQNNGTPFKSLAILSTTVVRVYSTTASTVYTDGAFIVDGGVGIAGQLSINSVIKGGSIKVYTDGTSAFSLFKADGTTPIMRSDTTNNLTCYYGSPTVGLGKLQIITPATATAAIGAIDESAMAAGVGGSIAFAGNYLTAGGITTAARIKAYKSNATNGQYGFGLAFHTRENGSVDALKMFLSETGLLGIGAVFTTPVTKLHVAETITTSPRGITSSQHNTGTDGARIHLRKSRGTITSPTVVAASDMIGRIVGSGYVGATNTYKECISIDYMVIGTVNDTGTGRCPSNMIFSTMPDADSSLLTECFRLTQAQGIAYNTAGAIKTVNTTIDAADLRARIAVVGTGGNVNCTSIAAGINGQRIRIVGTSNTDTVTLLSTTSNIKLKDDIMFVLGQGDVIDFDYSTENNLNKWCEVTSR